MIVDLGLQITVQNYHTLTSYNGDECYVRVRSDIVGIGGENLLTAGFWRLL